MDMLGGVLTGLVLWAWWSPKLTAEWAATFKHAYDQKLAKMQ